MLVGQPGPPSSARPQPAYLCRGRVTPEPPDCADLGVIGGLAARVSSGTVHDPAGQRTHEVDVVVQGVADGKAPLLAIGEAKWNQVMGKRHADRLIAICDLIRAAGRYDARATRLLRFSGAGFTDELRAIAGQAPDITLIDVATLYNRSRATFTESRTAPRRP